VVVVVHSYHESTKNEQESNYIDPKIPLPHNYHPYIKITVCFT